MTPRESQALTFIREFIDAKGFPPSYEEIMRELGLVSKSNVHRIVMSLEAQRKVRRVKFGGAHRCLEVVGHRSRADLLSQAHMLADSVLRELDRWDHLMVETGEEDLYVVAPEELRALIIKVLQS